MDARAPLVFAFVLGLAFVLLLLTFRSLVIPIKAIVLNLLSVGAAYGLLTLVFQHGRGLGLTRRRVRWLPLFLFVILFGLSMDYHVFILSRIREGVRARAAHRGRRRAGHPLDRRRRHQRRRRHGRRVRRLRDARARSSSRRWASASPPPS